MSKGIVQTIAGGALIATGIFLEVVTFGASTPLTTFLISAGVGMTLSGVGTLLSKGPLSGVETSTRNPIAPWNVVYGRKRVGGTVVFINSFGDNDKYLDMVIVLAAHQCKSVDALLFDQQRIQIGAHNTSFTPVQQDVVIADLQRVGNVVTVTLQADIPLLSDGDQVIIERLPPGTGGIGLTAQGRFPVTVISHTPGTPGSVTFSYVSGGPAIHIVNAGHCKTAWPDYGAKVYMEVMLGDQTLGTTFTGMTSGTPSDGDPTHLITNSSNPWTANCSLVGKTAVFLRLHYNDAIFSNGLPQISFHVSGKNNIYDPRTSTSGYTENAALCIADYLSNAKWGFRAAYSTEIPTAPLIAAVNICDENVPVAAGGTEKRYTCNGGFPLTMKRGEVLQNLLTSCGGRLTYTGGQFFIWPAAWTGISAMIGPSSPPVPTDRTIYSILTGPFRWKPKQSSSNLFNGVKGTYISPVNNWQSSDFPRYAQDAEHGYNDGTSGNDYDANLDEDGGDRRWLDIQLPFTISCPMAQRLAKIELMRRRQQGTGTFLLNMSGYQFSPMDNITISLPYFGWAGKFLEIQATRFKIDKQSDGDAEITLLGTEIDVQETDPSVYAWSVGEELSPAGFVQANMPDTKTPAAPTNVLLSSDIGDIFVSWVAPADAFVLNGGHIEVQYQLVASPEGLWFSLAKMDPTIVQATIANLTAGDQYNVRVRSVNAAGIPSAWVYGAPFDVSPITPGPITVVDFQQALGEWAPYQVLGSGVDALFPNEYTFDLAQSYMALAGGAIQAKVAATGKLPVNDFIPNCGPVEIALSNVGLATTGGNIPGGTTVFLQVCATDEKGRYSPPSSPLTIEVPAGTNTNQIVLSGILWPSSSGLTGYTVFAAYQENLICGQQAGSLTGGGPYAPSSITVDGPFARSTYAVPNANTAKLRLKGRRLIHGGVLGASVTSLGANIIVSSDAIDSGGTDHWAGRVLAIIGRATGAAPFAAFQITAFNPLTGTFTLDSDPATAGVVAEDIFVVCFLGYDNSSDVYTIADSGISNSTNGHTGETVNDPNRVGNFVYVLKGLSRGRSSKIVANTATSYTLADPLEIDASSVWIVVAAAWTSFSEVPIVNSDPLKATSIEMDVSNFDELPMLIGASTVDDAGNESADGQGPVRMIWIAGQAGAGSALGGYAVIPIVSGHAEPDLANGITQEVVFDSTHPACIVDNPIWTGGAFAPSQKFSLILVQDATGGRTINDWGTDFIGVGAGTASPAQPSPDSLTYSRFDFEVRLDLKFALIGSQLGIPNS
jgi:hypothetical protein